MSACVALSACVASTAFLPFYFSKRIAVALAVTLAVDLTWTRLPTQEEQQVYFSN